MFYSFTGTSYDTMVWDFWTFLSVAIVVFGIAMLALGIFSGYFGKGKNRNFGLVMAVVGLVVLAIWNYLCLFSEIDPYCNIAFWNAIVCTIVPLVAVIVGVLIAAGIFLVTVLKS